MKTIDHNGDDGNNQLTVGDAGGLVDIKTYQAIYNQITGKTEKAVDFYNENLIVNFDDIKNLYEKIHQIAGVHNVIASNFSASFFHLRGKKRDFSSYEKMISYDFSNPSPVTSIVMRFYYSIKLPDVNRPQEYVVVARIISRVAKAKQMDDDAPPFIRGRVISMIKDKTAEISVEYVDYLVARSFLEAFKEWIDACDKTPDSRWLSFFQRYSFLFPRFGAFLGLIMAAYYCVSFYAAYSFPVGETFDLYQAMTITFVASIVGFLVFLEIFRSAELSVDSYPIVSYLKINRGDENLIKNVNSRNKVTLIKLIGVVVLPIILSVVAGLITNWISSNW